jgi:hypothetical protein
MKMKQMLVAVAILASLGAAVHSHDANASTPTPKWMSTPCPTEDSSNCYWDAGEAGNGRGHSFYAIRMANGDTCLAYWESRYARHHNHCIPR